MESIARAVTSALQLSKRGGGVGLNLTNVREHGAPIKKIENQSSGVIPVMKMLEDAFSYANQLGARQGAGAVYLNAHHPDIMKFLDTKKENADEKTRIKTLSLGVVIPDITIELAKTNEDMYLFSPYDVERVYGKPMSDISITEIYQQMVDDPRIRKSKIKARELFEKIAELQFESGYPYIVYEDTVNKENPIDGRINMSNLCSEILQVNTPTTYNNDMSYKDIGKDISAFTRLASLAIASVDPNEVIVNQRVVRSSRPNGSMS
jgi:ribonucleoside-diphosphate reductase alpha chain